MVILPPSLGVTSHWYDQSGAPIHRLPTARGATRPTTLRDAKKLRLLPSVTNVLGILGRPALENWKMIQVARASLRISRHDEESDEEYAARIVEASFEETNRAADLGSRIHKALEGIWYSRPFPDDLKAYGEPALAKLRGFVGQIVATEKVFVNHTHGFAGTSDLVVNTLRGNRAVLDFKCRKTSKGREVDWYPEQVMQISAYAATAFGEDQLPQCHGANLLISTAEPGRVEVKHYGPDQLVQAFGTFRLVCELWRRLKDYDPRIQ